MSPPSSSSSSLSQEQVCNKHRLYHLLLQVHHSSSHAPQQQTSHGSHQDPDALDCCRHCLPPFWPSRMPLLVILLLLLASQPLSTLPLPQTSPSTNSFLCQQFCYFQTVLDANRYGISCDKVQDLMKVRDSKRKECLKVDNNLNSGFSRRDVFGLTLGLGTSRFFYAKTAGKKIWDDNIPLVTTEFGLQYKDIKIG